MKHIFLTCLLVLAVSTTALATSWAFEFVVYENGVYEVTDEDVTVTGEKLGEVTAYSDMEQLAGNFSNHYQVGTTYYEIEGIDPGDAIAVEIAANKYKKAVYDKPYNFTEEGPVISWYMWIVVSIAVIVLVLMFIIIRRERKLKRK